MNRNDIMLTAAAIAAVLRANDIKRVVVEYAGDGDEGGVDAYRFFDADDAEIPQDEVPDLEVTLPGDMDGSPLNDALYHLLDETLTLVGQEYYEDGDGGTGELHLHADGVFRLEHRVRVTTYQDHTHYFH